MLYITTVEWTDSTKLGTRELQSSLFIAREVVNVCPQKWRFKVEYQHFREVYIRLRLLIKSVVGSQKYAFRSLLCTF